MFEAPVDTLYLWLALGGVSIALLGVVAAVPTTAPPDATGTAATIDEVTTSPPGSVARRSSTAEEWTLNGRQLGLRNGGGSSHATLNQPAIPVQSERLSRVLHGRDPEGVFDSPATFEQAITSARARPGDWRTAPDRLTIRHVVWGAVDVTLVG